MESQHYRSAGVPVLPRNRPLQFREELLWLPGAGKLYPPSENGVLDAIRLIPPEKAARSHRAAEPLRDSGRRDRRAVHADG